jgi:hypothetical protein
MLELLCVVANADIHVFRNRGPINETSCCGEYSMSGLDSPLGSTKFWWSLPEAICSQDSGVEIKNARNFICSRRKSFDVVAFQVLMFPVRLSTLATLMLWFVPLHKYGRFNEQTAEVTRRTGTLDREFATSTVSQSKLSQDTLQLAKFKSLKQLYRKQ